MNKHAFKKPARLLLLGAITALLLSICSCGSGQEAQDVPSDSDPLISSIEPASASPDQTVTIKGVGFSAAPENNIIILGERAFAAATYALLDPPTDSSIEQITFVVPGDMPAGEYQLLLFVEDKVSNPVVFTVAVPAKDASEN